LADWLVPSAPFTLRCRQQACENIAAGASVEQAAPHCKDLSRLPSPLGTRLRCDRAVTSAVRGGVSDHPGIPTVLKRQPLRPNWTDLNWRTAGSTPVSATKES
jgi:hypothetical protein